MLRAAGVPQHLNPEKRHICALQDCRHCSDGVSGPSRSSRSVYFCVCSAYDVVSQCSHDSADRLLQIHSPLPTSSHSQPKHLTCSAVRQTRHCCAGSGFLLPSSATAWLSRQIFRVPVQGYDSRPQRSAHNLTYTPLGATSSQGRHTMQFSQVCSNRFLPVWRLATCLQPHNEFLPQSTWWPGKGSTETALAASGRSQQPATRTAVREQIGKQKTTGSRRSDNPMPQLQPVQVLDSLHCPKWKHHSVLIHKYRHKQSTDGCWDSKHTLLQSSKHCSHRPGWHALSPQGGHHRTFHTQDLFEIDTLLTLSELTTFATAWDVTRHVQVRFSPHASHVTSSARSSLLLGHLHVPHATGIAQRLGALWPSSPHRRALHARASFSNKQRLLSVEQRAGRLRAQTQARCRSESRQPHMCEALGARLVLPSGGCRLGGRRPLPLGGGGPGLSACTEALARPSWASPVNLGVCTP